MRRILYIVCFVLLVFRAENIRAQQSRAGMPLQTGRGHQEMEWIRLGEVRTDRLMLEDEWEAMTGKKSQRIAQEIPFALHPHNSGHWQTHPDGTRIWQLGIQGKGAHALGLVFDRYILMPGARLFVFNPGRTRVLGAFTDLNNKSSAMLAVDYLNGEELVVQLEVPSVLPGYGELQIGSVRYAYRSVFEDDSYKDGSFGLSGDCNVDVNCSQGADWQVVKHSVVRLMSNEKCTGVLINNTNQDGKPYLLTAAHCVFDKNSGKYHSMVFYFNYESPSCEGPDGIDYHTISGARLVATGDTSETEVDTDSLDFALLELSVAPPDSFLPYYAGWNRSPSPAQTSTTLHHPQGDVMKISVDDDPPRTDYHTEPYLDDLAYGSFWRIEDWEVGATEGGSSGAPLFDRNQLVTGTLTGGIAECDNPVNDYFTRFDYAWDYYEDTLKQLKYWLDPGNTGVMFLGGLDPVGFENIARQESPFVIYPNPARDRIHIEFGSPDGGTFEINIYNSAGILVHRQRSAMTPRAAVSVGRFPAGIYLLQVRKAGLVASGRFIIQK